MSIVCGVPKPWGNIGVVFVAYSLLHLTRLPAVSDRTKGLIQTIGDDCQQQGRALLLGDLLSVL
jgi:hypothetical protein